MLASKRLLVTVSHQRVNNMFFILDFFLPLSCNVRYIRATLSLHGRVTLSSQPCFCLIYLFRSSLLHCFGIVVLTAKSSSELSSSFFLLLFNAHRYIFNWESRKREMCASFFFFCLFTPQAITATSAPGEMTALWTKFGGKTAPLVAYESATKLE